MEKTSDTYQSPLFCQSLNMKKVIVINKSVKGVDISHALFLFIP